MARKWVDKVTDISRVSDWVIVIKVLVQRIIISKISAYATECGLDDNQKDNFYDNLINVVRKLGKKEIGLGN